MGALPYTNISIGGIAQELVNVGSYSLRALSANIGKSTPDGMSEFRGYQLPTTTIYLHQTTALLENVDSYGQFQNTTGYGGPNFEYVGPFGNIVDYNTEQSPALGSFLTNGGYSATTVHGRWPFTVYAFTNTYSSGPPRYPIYTYIDWIGVGRVAQAQCPEGFSQIYYTFTTTPGDSPSFQFGLDYGTL